MQDNRKLKEENNLLKYKLEVVVDMVSLNWLCSLLSVPSRREIITQLTEARSQLQEALEAGHETSAK